LNLICILGNYVSLVAPTKGNIYIYIYIYYYVWLLVRVTIIFKILISGVSCYYVTLRGDIEISSTLAGVRNLFFHYIFIIVSIDIILTLVCQISIE